MKSKTTHSLIVCLILTVGYLTSVTAVTDAELEALEKQIEQQEVEEKQKVEAEAKRKAEQNQKAEAEAKRKVDEELKRKIEVEAKKLAEEKRKLEAEKKRLAEEEAKRKKEERIAEIERKRKQELVLAGEMVDIPGGTFEMGSNEEYDSASPIHTVIISPFKIGKYEVTFDQWDACVADGGCDSQPDDKGWGRGNRPVIIVTWDEVQVFIKWLNQKTGGHYRLPSEAEWEYACRSGGKSETYCGGNNLNDLAWYNKNSGDMSHPVGQKHPNGVGLYDMSGNVEEWIEDCRNDSYDGAPSDGSVWEDGNCSSRGIRGGSWFHNHGPLRSTRSVAWPADLVANYYLGFRLAQDK